MAELHKEVRILVLALCAVMTLVAVTVNMSFTADAAVQVSDPLPSWNQTTAKQALLAVVEKVTRDGSPILFPRPNASACSITMAHCGRKMRCRSTINNPHPSFGMLIHHIDAKRDYVYDAKSKSSGKLVMALKDAPLSPIFFLSSLTIPAMGISVPTAVVRGVVCPHRISTA
jgi:hypothetical protein